MGPNHQAGGGRPGQWDDVAQGVSQAGGATTIYVIDPRDDKKVLAAAKKSRLGPSKAPLQKGIYTKNKYDVRLRLDEFLSQQIAVERLSEVPFGLGLTVEDWGKHTFVYSFGNIYEVHYEKGPRSERVFEKSPIKEFMAKWGSIVLAIPHGPWNK